MQYIVVFITVPDKKEGQRIIRALLDKRIVACCNMIDNVESYFWWKNKKEKAKESLLIAKTRKSSLKKLISVVKKNHSYEIPEIIALPILEGYKPYLDWIKKETT